MPKKSTKPSPSPSQSSSAKPQAATPSNLFTSRRGAAAKEPPPFKWKLVAESDGFNVVLLKTIEKKDSQNALDNLGEQGYYDRLQIYPIDASIPQPKLEAIRKKERKEEEKLDREAAKEAERKRKEKEREKKRKEVERKRLALLRKREKAEKKVLLEKKKNLDRMKREAERKKKAAKKSS